MLNQECLNKGRSKSVIREIAAYGTKRKKEIGDKNVFDFSIGNPNTPTPKCMDDAIVSMLSNDNFDHGYTNAVGILEVREKISKDLKDTYNLNVSSESIYMTCGAAASLSITFRAILNPGDEVILIAPFFSEYSVFIEASLGKTVITKARSSDLQIDINEVEKAINNNTKAVLINTPNNPVGSIYDEDNLKELSDLLRRKEKEYGHPIYLVSDEPYRELVFEGKFYPPLYYYDDSIMCYSFSKSMSLAGERIGYIAVNDNASNHDELVSCIAGAGRMLGYVNAPALMQKAIAKCIGQYSDLETYRFNRDTLCKMLDELNFEYIKPKGAFYIFIKSPIDDFYKVAMKHEILVVPSDSFGYPGYVRLAYCVSKETVLNSIESFKALKKDCE